MQPNNGQLVPFDVALTDWQKSLIKKPYQESGISRGVAYLREEGVVKKIFSPTHAFGSKMSTEDVAQMSVATGAAGYSVSLVASAGAFACTGKVATAATGALLTGASLVGCIAALAIFEGIVICTNLVKIYSSPEYLAWRARRKELMTNKAVVDFLRLDTILRHLLCPLTGEIPLLPAKTGRGVTYDYHAATQWVKDNPGQFLPGLDKLVDEEDFCFDYAHINSVIERLYNLKTVLSNESETIMRNRMRMISTGGISIDLWIEIVKILVIKGDLDLGQTFFACDSLNFVHKVLHKCGHDLGVANINRRERYRAELMDLVKLPAVSVDEKLRLFRDHMTLIQRAGVIKNLYVTTLPNQQNAFVAFWRRVFFINPHSYFLATEYDQKNMRGNEILWADGINIPIEPLLD